MKRRTIIIIVIVLVSFFLTATGELHYINVGEYFGIAIQRSDRAPRETPDKIGIEKDEADAEIPLALEFESNPDEEASIGYQGFLQNDNPADNLFNIVIDQQISPSDRFVLEYELYGVEDLQGVCRSINDQPSFGGWVVQKNEEWSLQQEELPHNLLQQGTNVIRFTAFPDLEYGYKIKDLKVRVIPGESKALKRIILNQPENRPYYGTHYYLRGYVESPGTSVMSVMVDGKQARIFNGEFEVMGPVDGKFSWNHTARVVANFADGEILVRDVVFDKEGKADLMNVIPSQILSIEHQITAQDPFCLELAGARLSGEASSVHHRVDLRMQRLAPQEILPVATGMINATEGKGGFRLLPHGTRFQKQLTLELPYAQDLPAGYTSDDIYSFYFDEQARQWIRLERIKVDPDRGVIISLTDHFTDFINGILKVPEAPTTNAFTPNSIKDLQVANPLDEIALIEPPTANSDGSAEISLPIKLPAGRNGLQPSLALNYSSRAGNGWLGLGWSLNVPAITVETRWGVPHYDAIYESETYLLNGQQLARKDTGDLYYPLAHRAPWLPRPSGTETRFYPRTEGAFQKIVRHGTHPDNYYWEAISPDGMHYFYGKKFNLDEVDPTVVRDAVPATSATFNIAYWPLTEVVDPFGNNIRYYYDLVLDAGVEGGSDEGIQVYLSQIRYTGKDSQAGNYYVDFIRVDKQLYQRPDATIDGRQGHKQVTADLLQRIEISYNQSTLIRTYFMAYQQGEFEKTLLCGVAETDSIGYSYYMDTLSLGNNKLGCGEFLQAYQTIPGILPYKFEYYNDIQDGSGMFTAPYPLNTPLEDLTYNLAFNQGIDPSGLASTRSRSFDFGGSFSGGYFFEVWNKKLSGGGNFHRTRNNSEGMISLIDLNGDGLPDKVWKDRYNGDIRYRMQYFDTLSSQYKFRNYPKTLSGMPSFLRQTTKASDWGLEAQFVVSASYGRSVGNSNTEHYFTDIDADGIVDLAANGIIYFGRWNPSDSSMSFQDYTSDTIWYGGQGCGYILNNGSIDDSIFMSGPATEQFIDSSRMDFMTHYFTVPGEIHPAKEAVKVWIAPYDGTVEIRDTVFLSPEHMEQRFADRLFDGVMITVQRDQDILFTDTLVPGIQDTLAYAINDTIQRLDRIYFRVQPLTRRALDMVYMDPTVCYTSVGNQAVLPSSKDANGQGIYCFQASKGFLITGSQKIKFPIQGKVKVTGTLSCANNLSDTVHLLIMKNWSNLVPKYSFSSAIPVPIAQGFVTNVNEGDSLQVIMLSSSKVDWQSIDWRVRVEYTESTPTGPIVIDSTDPGNLKPYIAYDVLPEVMGYFQTIQPTTSWTPSQSMQVDITPLLTVNTSINDTGYVSFTIKKKDQIVHEQKILLAYPPIVPPISPPSTYTLNALAGETYYFDFHTGGINSVDNINDAVYKRGNDNTFHPAGLHRDYPGELSIFGPLCQGWGQFEYLSPDSTTEYIIEDSLKLSERLYNPPAQSTAPDSQNFDTLYQYLISQGVYDPRYACFNMMIPDVGHNCYSGPDGLTTVKKNSASLFSVLEDSVYVQEFPVPYVKNRAVRAVFKQTRNISNSLSLGGHVPIDPDDPSNPAVSAGGYYSWGHSSTTADIRDFNGDRFPDILSGSRIQYTNSLGALSSFTRGHTGLFEEEQTSFKTFGINAGIRPPKANKRPGSKRNDAYSTSSSGNAGADQGRSTNYAEGTWMDINGDGLPDKLKKDGSVILNLGYYFSSDADNWDYPTLQYGLSTSTGGSAGLEAAMANTLGSKTGSFLDKHESSLSLGFSLSSSENQAQRSFYDFNGDGLLDIFQKNASEVKIYFNTGGGFMSTPTVVNIDQINWSHSVSGGVFGAISFGFTIPITPLTGIKCVINPKVGWGRQVDMNRREIMDMNGDGYADIVTSSTNDLINVRYNRTGRTNMLKQVHNPGPGYFSIDYELPLSSYEMPSREYRLSEVRTYDGFDQLDTKGYLEPKYALARFEYFNGWYNRYEREFFGYDSIASHLYYRDPGNPAQQKVICQKFHNHNYMFKGLKHYEALRDQGNQLFTETFFKYKRKEIETGTVIDMGNEFCYGEGYPAVDTIIRKIYEGQGIPPIVTREVFTHGPLGNVITYQNDGDVDIDDDDILVTIDYYTDLNNYIVNVPEAIKVFDVAAGGGPVRQRDAVISNTGKVSQLTLENGSKDAIYDLYYDAYGNISKIDYPENAGNQRYSIEYTYDNQVNTYPIATTDVFNYNSEATYDLRYGKPLSVTDVSGNQMLYSYDGFGRIKTTTGPKEIAANIPFTIRHLYWNDSTYPPTPPVDSLIWAATEHYDPEHPNNLIQTIIFADGWGKAVQTKKDAVWLDEVSMNYTEGRMVSGRLIFNELGKVLRNYQPVAEDISQDLFTFNPTFDTIEASYFNYDAMDRILVQSLPDKSTINTAYSILPDANNVQRLATITVDPNGIATTQLNDVQGKIIESRAPHNATTRFAYNVLGELLYSTNPDGFTTYYAYDLLGQLIERHHPDAGVTVFDYDPSGKLSSTLTANLQQFGQPVEYVYDYNLLKEIQYPLNPVNNVRYEYAPAGSGNQTGKIEFVEDATGATEYEYGSMGELTSSRRYLAVPGHGQHISFETRWEYDSWNRVKLITYPDGEEVTYHYNTAGSLDSVAAWKENVHYGIVDSIGYDRQGRRSFLALGNGARTFYAYDQYRGYLNNLDSYDGYGNALQKNIYTFEPAGNIISIINQAGATPYGIGGFAECSYEYDSLYRLIVANGFWENGDQYHYNLDMVYSPAGMILEKRQIADIREASGALTPMHNEYSYIYNFAQPHTVENISGTSNHAFNWDANGNMTYHGYEESATERRQCWDEENRLMGVGDGNTLAHYIYDAAGERTMKFTGQLSHVQVNKSTWLDYAIMDRSTYYINPLMVVGSKEYTKHYFIEGQRVMSKIGGGMEDALIALHRTPQAYPVDMVQKAEQININLADVLSCMDINAQTVYEIKMDWLDNMTQQQGPEQEQYFYHSDHLGSSAFITDAGGLAIQHLEYLPFGELFIEERTTWNTPYKFSGKELDEETGYSYFGARYYDPNISIWLSVDPMADKYPSVSPYMYCAGNPIMFIDPDGRTIVITGEDGASTKYIPGMEYNGNDKFTANAITSLNELYGGKSDQGFLVVNELHKSKNEFNIESAKSENNFTPSDVKRAYAGQIKDDPNLSKLFSSNNSGVKDILYGGSGGTIRWDMNGTGVVSEKGLESNPTANLSHELSHAFDANFGQMNDRVENGMPRSEWQACYRANVIRNELGMQYQRIYGGNVDPSGNYVGGGIRILNNRSPIQPKW
jgi:RHS repeat-associated protein